jgi:hypothetical protein
MSDTLDLFAALHQRDEAIAQADQTVTQSVGGDVLVGRVTDRVTKTYAAGQTFSVDDLGVILDEMQVPKDLETRRRIVSTIINRGKDKLWVHAGYISSRDPRRNARPVALWRRLSIHDPLAGVPQPARLGRAEL